MPARAGGKGGGEVSRKDNGPAGVTTGAAQGGSSTPESTRSPERRQTRRHGNGFSEAASENQPGAPANETATSEGISEAASENKPKRPRGRPRLLDGNAGILARFATDGQTPRSQQDAVEECEDAVRLVVCDGSEA